MIAFVQVQSWPACVLYHGAGQMHGPHEAAKSCDLTSTPVSQRPAPLELQGCDLRGFVCNPGNPTSRSVFYYSYFAVGSTVVGSLLGARHGWIGSIVRVAQLQHTRPSVPTVTSSGILVGVPRTQNESKIFSGKRWTQGVHHLQIVDRDLPLFTICTLQGPGTQRYQRHHSGGRGTTYGNQFCDHAVQVAQFEMGKDRFIL